MTNAAKPKLTRNTKPETRNALVLFPVPTLRGNTQHVTRNPYPELNTQH
jgi:hypothetical protein